MLLAVVTLFALCWLPLHLFTLVVDYNPELMQYKTEQEKEVLIAGFYIVHWLAMSNSFVNPIVYSFLNDNFRVNIHDYYGLFKVLDHFLPLFHRVNRLASRQRDNSNIIFFSVQIIVIYFLFHRTNDR